MNTRLFSLLVGLFCTFACYKTLDQPLRAIAKKTLDVGAGTAALLVALVMLAHTFRPLIGLGLDSTSRRGIDPRRWLRLAAVIGIAAGFLITSRSMSVPGTLSALGLTVACIVTIEVVVDAAIAGEQARGVKTAFLGSARTFVSTAVVVISSLAGGWISEAPLQRLGPVVVVLMMVVLVTTGMMRRPAAPPAAPHAGDKESWALARSAALFGFVFYVVPGFGTVLYYRQTGELGFPQLAVGGLGALNNLTGLAGVVLYYRWRKRAALPTVLPPVIVLYALSSAVYLAYPSGWVAAATPPEGYLSRAGGLVAPAVEIVNGLLSTMGICAASEAIVRGAGGKGKAARIAMILCACNVAISLSDMIGSALYAWGWLSLGKLIVLNMALYCLLAVAMARTRSRWLWLRG